MNRSDLGNGMRPSTFPPEKIRWYARQKQAKCSFSVDPPRYFLLVMETIYLIRKSKSPVNRSIILSVKTPAPPLGTRPDIQLNVQHGPASIPLELLFPRC